MNRHPTQPETAALTSLAISLATLAWTWTPGLITPAVLAVLTYLALVTGAAKLLRWNAPHTLLATSITLRHTAATLIRATAWTLQTITQAILWLLNEAHTHLTTSYTTAA